MSGRWGRGCRLSRRCGRRSTGASTANNVDELSTVGNASALMSRAALSGTERGTHSEGNGSRATDVYTAYKDCRIRALELALEEPVELGVAGGGLAVLDG